MGGLFGGLAGPGTYPRPGRSLHLGDRPVRIPGWVKRAGRAVSIDAFRRAAGAALGGSGNATEDSARWDHVKRFGLSLNCENRGGKLVWWVHLEEAPFVTLGLGEFSDPRAAIDAHRKDVRHG